MILLVGLFIGAVSVIGLVLLTNEAPSKPTAIVRTSTSSTAPTLTFPVTSNTSRANTAPQQTATSS